MKTWTPGPIHLDVLFSRCDAANAQLKRGISCVISTAPGDRGRAMSASTCSFADA